jgi:arylformamidase
MRLIDMSQPIFDNCPNCPEHPPVKSEVITDHHLSGWRLELLTIASHTGSHVDTPLHKLKGGANLDDIPLEKWTGQAFIADLRDSQAGMPITPHRLSQSLANRDLSDQIVLIATTWGDRRAKTDEWLNKAPMLSAEAARWLVDRRIRGVGIDYYSIGDAAVHEILLGNNAWIVEELKFSPEVFQLPQPVMFWCLPINFKGHTGAFCRPVIVVS